MRQKGRKMIRNEAERKKGRKKMIRNEAERKKEDD